MADRTLAKSMQILNRIQPASPSQRRSAALVCASHALTRPEPETALSELLDLLGLYTEVDKP